MADRDRPASPADNPREQCGFCEDGLIPGKRDQWGFGVPCPHCDGTGVVQ